MRRSGHRVDARTRLRQALAIFEQLGARTWVEKARSELRASGETIRAHDPTARDELTPQELKVALVIADGASNQEAAAALFLSPKTIEAHLGRVYRKLGIRSRSELIRYFTTGEAVRTSPIAEERLAAAIGWDCERASLSRRVRQPRTCSYTSAGESSPFTRTRLNV